MPSEEVIISVPVTLEEFVDAMFDSSSVSYFKMLDMISYIDNKAQDWDFTLDLFLIMAEKVSEYPDEVKGLEDCYQEKLEKVRECLKKVT